MSVAEAPAGPPREAFAELSRGALYNLVSAIIAIIGAIVMTIGLLSVYAPLMQGMEGVEVHRPGYVEAYTVHVALGTVAAAIALGGVILLVAVIVFILGWLKFNRATSLLASYNPGDYSIGHTGTKLFIAGLVVELIGLIVAIAGALTSPGLFIMGLGVVGLGGLLQLIGMILFAVMLMRLGSLDGSFKTAGIILLVGIVLSLITYTAVIGAVLVLVGYYLVYSAAKRQAEAAPEAAATTPAT